MKVCIIALGSRGDTQPAIALGHRLGQAGHEVSVVAPGRYGPLVTGAGLISRPLTVDPVAIMETDRGQEWLASGPIGFVRGIRAVVEPVAEQAMVEISSAAADADVVLAPSIAGVGRNLTDRFGMPHALMHFQPNEPTREFANPLLTRDFGALGNRASFAIIEGVTALVLGRMLNRLRSRVLDLGPSRRSSFHLDRRDRVPVLCGVSEVVCPRPKDWPEWVHMTGFWMLEQPHAEDPALAQFLDDGAAPIHVGFGSMVPKDPEALADKVIAALRQVGRRGVIQGLPAGDRAAAGDMYFAGNLDYARVFPRMAAVVHHGGPDTAALGLAAGVPNLACTFFSDQPFWGARIASIGAGPAPLSMAELTQESLAGRLTQMLADRHMHSRAAAVGRALRAEDGAARAAAIVEARFSDRIRDTAC